MANNTFEERKIKSNDIVNGLARKDLFDSNGVLLVKKGSRVKEAHFKRMREEGLIQEEVNKKDKSYINQGINYVNPNSVHGKLDQLISALAKLQKKIIVEADNRDKDELDRIINILFDICDENIFQVLGELYISEMANYNQVRPLYIAASLIELINRYNQYEQKQLINDSKTKNLVDAALLHNIGLIQQKNNNAKDRRVISPEERAILRKNYPEQSIQVMNKMGISNSVSIEAVKNHNMVNSNPSLEALLLRTPFIYADIALSRFPKSAANIIINPCKEFAKLFSEKKLDPVLGGLFLKINGLVPVGAILIFETLEKAMVVTGPDNDNILSSKLRFLTNRSGLQLGRPGEVFYLHKTSLVQKGLVDHHSFAWSKFAPFTMWER